MADFFAKGNKPINGYGGVQHDLVELWKNPNIGTAFAGQTVTIQNFDSDKIDAIVIVPSVTSNEGRLGGWYEIDKDVLNVSNWSGLMEHATIQSSDSRILLYWRTISVSLSGTTLSVTFSNATQNKQNSIGSASIQTTNNSLMIPVRILGLIHND